MTFGDGSSQKSAGKPGHREIPREGVTNRQGVMPQSDVGILLRAPARGSRPIGACDPMGPKRGVGGIRVASDDFARDC